MTQNWYLARSMECGQSTVYYPLIEGENTVGRTSKNNIVLQDNTISARHAVVICCPNGVSILDLPISKNGLRVNGHRSPKDSPQPLKEGDIITIGGVKLVLCMGQFPGSLNAVSALPTNPNAKPGGQIIID